MKIHEFRSELLLAHPVDAVFPYFADAANLEAITPPCMHFHVITPQPVEMRVGALIDYRLRVRGVPVRWQSEITVWEPQRRFVDEQRRGPYRLWKHEHLFEPCEGGTRVIDSVHYAVPFDFLSHRLIVRPDIERIFSFRRERLLEQFPPPVAVAPEKSG